MLLQYYGASACHLEKKLTEKIETLAKPKINQYQGIRVHGTQKISASFWESSPKLGACQKEAAAA
jgi:hypothetical protein